MKNTFISLVLLSVLMISSSTKTANGYLQYGYLRMQSPDFIVRNSAAPEWNQRINVQSFKILSNFLKDDSTNTQNLLFSPLSIYVSLGMLNEGIREKAAKQLNEYFGFNSPYKFASGLEISALKGIRQIFNYKQLRIANGLFGSQQYPIEAEYVELIKKKYSAEAFNVDFGRESGIDQINQWVQKTTNDKIKSIITQPNPLIVMILANAVYFKANWKNKFGTENTFRSQFYNFKGDQVMAEYMEQKNNFRYRNTQGITLLELVYDEVPVSMVIAMQKSGNPITNQDETISKFIREVGTDANTKVIVKLPKFKFESTHELKNYYQSSLPTLFEEEYNPKICQSTKTFVSSILHKTFIQVDEQGTEAAAVTAVIMATRAISMDPEITINKSFHFYIVDHRYKLILFSGFVNKPEF